VASKCYDAILEFSRRIRNLTKEADMNIAQIAGKLRGQIAIFSGKLSAGLPKVMRRFVAEALYGIAARGSVRLSEIARALDEGIHLKKTIDRISARLAYPGLRKHLTEAVIVDASSRIGWETLLIIDLSDIVKQYAEKMQYIAQVYDGSKGELASGYWTCDVVAAEVGEANIIPLYHELYSTVAPDFESENIEILKALEAVSQSIGKRGIYVMDRGGDRGKLYYPLLNQKKRFLIRLVGDRHLIHRGRKVLANELASGCPLPYADRIVKEDKGEEKVYMIDYGFRRVRLPGRGEQLYLVVVKGFGVEPMMLLTNVPMHKKRKVLWWAVEAYLTRWRVEETIRFLKQSYQLEDIRVLTYERLRNLAALVLGVAYFTAVHLGLRTKLEILAGYALRAAKRIFGIPDFRYYALADGIKSIFARSGRGFRSGDAKDPPIEQLFLFV
jgi:hypothetical protein